MDNPRVTIMVPCRNEADYILTFLNSLSSQDYEKELVEVLIGDGMSDDGTRSKVLGYSELSQLELIDNPERTVPFALNRCIDRAQGEIIIRMDVHAIYPSNYLSRLVEVLIASKADNVGGVIKTAPADETSRSTAIAIAMSHPLGVGDASFRTGANKITEVDTVPFGCFRSELFERIGKYDTDLTRNQDDEFNARILQSGGKILLIPDLTITYFARPKLKKLVRMYFQYGLFKPLVNRKLKRPATLRQFVPPLFVLFLFIGLPLMFIDGFLFRTWLLVLGVYLSAVLLISIQLALSHKRIKILGWLVLSFFSMHISYGWGYLKGVWRFLILRQSPSGENTELSR